MTVLPHRFLFRYSLPVVHIGGLPHQRGDRLLDLPAECALANFAELDGANQFAEIRLAWNANGFGISVEVAGKSQPPACDRGNPVESDGLQVWIDTRNTQSIHRASRFCHHFCLLPCGDVRDAMQPVAVQVPIAQAREHAPQMDPNQISVHVEWLGQDNSNRSRRRTKKSLPIGTSYRMEAWIPADVLHGFEVARASHDGEIQPTSDRRTGDGDGNHAKFGFNYCVRDTELGNQHLSVGEEFPFAHDPSLWSTLELVHGTQ